jgi:hypothetical protein
MKRVIIGLVIALSLAATAAWAGGPHYWCYVDYEGGPCISPIYFSEPPDNATIAVLD